MFFSNQSDFSVGNCPNFTDSEKIILSTVNFWMRGVSQTVIAILGIIGNVISSIIISRKEMRNSFNLLLVSLAVFDSTYLFGSILESFREEFLMASDAHILLFPYLLYPLSQMAFTASIFMTVAIAWERYTAVHFPLDYNLAMNDSNAMRKRLVIFFEAKIYYEKVIDDGNTTFSYIPRVGVAEMRTHPIYIVYHNWGRLIVLGIIPFGLLVFFNYKIFKDIRERRKRRIRIFRRSRSSNICKSTSFLSSRHPTPAKRTKSYNPSRSNACSVVNAPIPLNGGRERSYRLPVSKNTHSVNQPMVPIGRVTVPTAASLGADPEQHARIKRRNVQSHNERRRNFEDNLAGIFMGFVSVFLICHIPRLLLNIHELITIKEYRFCRHMDSWDSPFGLF
ncbi:TAAR [Lepeophtheirus salmonis]|uniref:TAAR n=1 Tax=Lepeophtheirus salmonis TaxID=72036 RepID=A0A7R8CG77_LEPSM|nr:TAAR [Lepeophtheirus salmonis]CAF2813177.1 TAAR [Lepeophtheirus salmonis]